MMELVNRVQTWQRLVYICKETCRLFDKYGKRCLPGRILPLQVGDQMAHLQDALNSAFKAQSYILDKLLPSMSSLKGQFTLTSGDNGIGLEVHRKHVCDPGDSIEQLRHHLNNLRKAALSNPMQGRSLAFEVIQRLPTSVVDVRLQTHLTEMMAVDGMFTDVLWDNEADGGVKQARTTSTACLRSSTSLLTGPMACRTIQCWRASTGKVSSEWLISYATSSQSHGQMVGRTVPG